MRSLSIIETRLFSTLKVSMNSNTKTFWQSNDDGMEVI